VGKRERAGEGDVSIDRGGGTERGVERKRKERERDSDFLLIYLK
jgi:hypothetical protein